MKQIILTYLVIIFTLTASFSQGVGIGLSGAYNFQTESFGAGVRLNVKPSNTVRIVPQVTYYPSFNKIHDLYLGLGLEINLFRIKRLSFYILGQGAYNAWLNYDEYNMKDAQTSNWALDLGGGITTNKGCFRPLLEYKYNVKWKETSLHLGLLFVFGCGSDSGYKSVRKMRRRAVSCPAYN